MIDKPCSPSCERNREPILAVLRQHFAGRRRVLEIGSGTGQHAVFFAEAMPWLTWQCSDRAAYLSGIRQWLEEAGLPNTPAPVELDVAGRWPDLLALAQWGDAKRGASATGQTRKVRPPPAAARGGFDAAFSANTLHIMGWEEVEAFFSGLRTTLADDATLVVYGPFNYGGAFTSDSNRAFDASLRARNPRMGIRDFAAVDGLAQRSGLRLVEDVAMPANNRCLVWRSA